MPVTNPMADRLCQAIRTFRAGDSRLLRHLLRVCQPGSHCRTDGDDPTLVFQTPAFTVGISPSSDITACCAQVGLALFEPLWPYIPEVQMAWRILHADGRTAARQRREARHGSH